MKTVGWIARAAVALVVAFVLVRLAPVIANEWRGLDACPKVGPLPACYAVAVCYAAMGIAVVAAPRRLAWLFLLGWVPVFALAATGTGLEVLGQPTCPVSPAGIPLCYVSLAVALVLLPAYFLARTSDLRRLR